MLLNYVKRFQLFLFFLLSLIISWAVWIPLAAITLSNPEGTVAGGNPLNLLAVCGPGLSAILLSLLMAGKAGPRALFRPIRLWRVRIQWYFIVLLYSAAVWLMALGIDVVLGKNYEVTFMPILDYFGQGQALYMVPAAFISAFPNTLGEELGWRGFALPKLQAKYNALVSSLILGLIWGIWHIPLWIAFGQTGISLFIAVMTTAVVAILYTWIYNSTGGSLLLVWLFHFSMTVTGYILSPIPTFTDDILSLGLVVLVVLIFGVKHLSRKKKV